ncbi:MAG: hypothetical protein EHM28_12675 [Spirochaetaceae bacterium]|nr:MAG: hypothetical protein EHM28_12675 [Spirochaetaceae bacterium]
MKYVKCQYCGFFLLDSERVCPDCGHRNPAKPPSAAWGVMLPFLALLVYLFVYIITLLSPEYRINLLWFFSSFLGVMIAAIIAGRKIDKLQRKDKIVSKKYLSGDEANIHKRIDEIKNRIEKLSTVRTNIKEGKKSEKMKSMLVLLDNAEEMLLKYEGKYRAELWKIGVIRYKNTLEPVEHDWQKLDYQGCIDRMKDLKDAISRGEALKTTQTTDPLSKTREGKEVVRELASALKICDQFFEGLTARQAKLAIKDISPVDETAKKKELETGMDDNSLFNTQSDVSTFVSAFEELESEFDRLEAEEKLSVTE